MPVAGVGRDGQCAGAPRGAMERGVEAVLPETGAARAAMTLQVYATENLMLVSLMPRKVDRVRRLMRVVMGSQIIPVTSKNLP